MVADCMFCKIVNGELSAQIVFEDDSTLVFLDHRPLFRGHCLLVPRLHFETLSELSTELIAPIFENVQLLSRAVEMALGAQGTFVAMNNRVSQSVPHLHIHIVPRCKGDGLKGFFWPRTKYQDEAAIIEVQKAICSAIKQLQIGVRGD
jgi:histidine triad (HIT) family protein